MRRRTLDTERIREARQNFGEHWRQIGPKAAVLDIFQKITHRENLGQANSGIIYVQEVAELLGIQVSKILQLCDELFEEEKLDLNGMILSPHISRFRFPKEIETLFAYIIEEPLGWPNGEAGDIFVAELEQAIQKHTRFKHGKEAFWPENYPHISPRHLLFFGLNWMGVAISKAESIPEALVDVSPWCTEATAKVLEDLARRIRNLSSQ